MKIVITALLYKQIKFNIKYKFNTNNVEKLKIIHSKLVIKLKIYFKDVTSIKKRNVVQNTEDIKLAKSVREFQSC